MRKVNYLNNKDILKEIHKSKLTYCTFTDTSVASYDTIVTGVNSITKKSVTEARKLRAERLAKEAQEAELLAGNKRKLDEFLVPHTKIPVTDVVFRVMTWEHIPIDDIKQRKADAKAQEEYDADEDNFETEYDESKVSITKDEMSDAVNSCLSSIPEGYTSNVDVERRSIKLKVTPDTTIGQKLLDELKASKTAKVVSNYDEVEKIGLDVIKELEKVLSEKLKKDIRYVRGISFYEGTGLFLFNGDKQEQMIAKLRMSNWAFTKTYKADIKRGFLKIDKCEIELETLEIEIDL